MNEIIKYVFTKQTIKNSGLGVEGVSECDTLYESNSFSVVKCMYEHCIPSDIIHIDDMETGKLYNSYSFEKYYMENDEIVEIETLATFYTKQ